MKCIDLGIPSVRQPNLGVISSLASVLVFLAETQQNLLLLLYSRAAVLLPILQGVWRALAYVRPSSSSNDSLAQFFQQRFRLLQVFRLEPQGKRWQRAYGSFAALTLWPMARSRCSLYGSIPFCHMP